MNPKKRCFVIQGYGKKQDYEQGKQFDLDASYKIIKKAVESTEMMECFRGDELRTNAMIDQVMYNQLLEADLVIADITTLNFNAAFELGVRFALRPYSTLIVGEEGMNFPFDINHIFIHKYQHLGEDIGASEAERFGSEIKKLVIKALENNQKDSPVYAFLNCLPEHGFIGVSPSMPDMKSAGDSSNSLREIIDKANRQMDAGKFKKAKKSWEKAREIAGKDDYIVQRLTLATYKSEEPTKQEALRKAETILEYLQPQSSYDIETLGLWGAVHKRLFQISKDTLDLDKALFALERGYFLNKNHYNGINLAFMLDVKARYTYNPEVKHETRIMARLIRRQVKQLCLDALKNPQLGGEDQYWVRATLYEICVGLQQEDEAAKWKKEAFRRVTADWMKKSTKAQIKQLRKLQK